MDSPLIPTLQVNDVDPDHASKSFERFSHFFEQAIFPMKIISLDGSLVVINSSWRKLFSDKPMDLKRTPIINAIQEAGAGESIEVPSFWYDSRWFEASVSPLKDRNGNIFEFSIILKDVTQKVETERALIHSISARKSTEEKYQLLSGRLSLAVKAGNIGIWEWVPDTNFISVDSATEKILGFGSGKFPRTSEAFDLCLHPADREHFWATISHALAGKQSYQIELRIIKQDDTVRWVQTSGMGLYDHVGTPYHMMGTVIDISDRKESEADQKFLSHASELLNCSLDHKDILRTVSEHAINYFCDGVFIDQLLSEGEIKRLMVVHKSPEVVKKLMDMDKRFPKRYEDNPVTDTLFSGKSLFIEDAEIFWKKIKTSSNCEYLESIDELNIKSSIRSRLKGRESILGMMTFFISKNSSKKFTRNHIWLAEELSYRASMAVENALIHQASQEAIKVRDEFLSIASHELKTPLQSLTLQNQMRKRNLDKKLHDAFVPEKLSGMVNADLRHLMRINRLIDDMLDISRIRAGKLTFMKEKIEYCSFVKDVIERFRPQLESVGCYMSASFCDPVEANIDVYRTEQVIVNLLTNAMKYGAGKPIKIEILKKQSKIQLIVHDKGPGIRQQDQERIFERFERAISSNEVSGLGLGLYISRQIMEQDRGSLFVQSFIGEGSSFVMELPLEN